MTEQPDDRYADLDAALAEELGAPASFRLLGQTWTLKSEQPTLVVLQAMRQQAAGLDRVSEDDTARLVDALVQPGTRARMLELGIGPTATDMVIAVAIGVYGGQTPAGAVKAWKDRRKAFRDAVDAVVAGEEPGEAPGPETAPTSSPAGA